MDRKEFLKKSAIAGAVAAIAPTALKASQEEKKVSTYEALMNKIGFNHIQKTEGDQTMKKIIHRAKTRGHANHGWLDTHHTFSFANYYNPERMNFGVLRVLNDDTVSAGRGFGTHPHDNMEIVSIPLEGDLEHKDSMGNTAVIKEGDVQVMSAGKGVFHSEFNKNSDSQVKFLQIWMFPNKMNVEPRYDQVSIRDVEKPDKFYQVLSPNKTDEGVWVHQDAWFNMANFSAGAEDTYTIKKTGNGAYLFVLKGKVEVEGETLENRDGMGIWDAKSITVKASEDAKVLLMDVPMSV